VAGPVRSAPWLPKHPCWRPTLLEPERLQRAIGIIHRPETERMSHYFEVRLARQFDLLLHVDGTHAVVPLDAPDHWPRPHEAETYPGGL